MLVTTFVLLDGKLQDAEALSVEGVVVCSVELTERRGLLATVVSVEDASFHLSYTSVICYPLRLTVDGRPDVVDLLHPLEKLRSDEQQTLRTTLIAQSWPAWARAPQHLRELLGVPEPPLLLAEAARRVRMSLSTLANAAVCDRLPTIWAGDRHLVYLDTLQEAEARRLLHSQRGRPHRKLTATSTI
jgi:hypothetical protein